MLSFALIGQIAEADSHITVVDGGEGIAAPYAQALQKRLGDTAVTLTTLGKVTQSDSTDTLYIAADGRALRGLLTKQILAPILSVQISKSSYLAALEADQQTLVAKVSAIYADPDPAVLLKLIHLLFPKNTTVGVLLGKETLSLAADIKEAGRANDIEVIIEKVAGDDDLYVSLNRISQAKVVLAVPDKLIYNRETIRIILLTTYRHGQALIGYAPGIVRAGGLATTTCGIDNMVDETLRWISEYRRNTTVPAPRYCREYDLIINEHVLKSLDIIAPQKEVLLRKLKGSMGGRE